MCFKKSLPKPAKLLPVGYLSLFQPHYCYKCGSRLKPTNGEMQSSYFDTATGQLVERYRISYICQVHGDMGEEAWDLQGNTLTYWDYYGINTSFGSPDKDEIVLQ